MLMVSDLSLPWKGLSINRYMFGQFNLFKPYMPEEYKIIWLILSWCVGVKLDVLKV